MFAQFAIAYQVAFANVWNILRGFLSSKALLIQLIFGLVSKNKSYFKKG
jgi:hypothetical protein